MNEHNGGILHIDTFSSFFLVLFFLHHCWAVSGRSAVGRGRIRARAACCGRGTGLIQHCSGHGAPPHARPAPRARLGVFSAAPKCTGQLAANAATVQAAAAPYRVQRGCARGCGREQAMAAPCRAETAPWTRPLPASHPAIHLLARAQKLASSPAPRGCKAALQQFTYEGFKSNKVCLRLSGSRWGAWKSCCACSKAFAVLELAYFLDFPPLYCKGFKKPSEGLGIWTAETAGFSKKKKKNKKKVEGKKKPADSRERWVAFMAARHGWSGVHRIGMAALHTPAAPASLVVRQKRRGRKLKKK